MPHRGLATCLLLFSLGLSGCDESAPDAPSLVCTEPQAEPRSGARLRAAYLTTSGGDRIPFGWVDSRLAVPCAWTAGADPMCLPEHARVLEEYADPACTEPLSEAHCDSATCSSQPPPYAAEHEECGWEVVTAVWNLDGTPYTEPFVYQRDPVDQSCHRVELQVPTVPRLRTGTRLPADYFVHGTLVELGEGRILTQAIHGDDGSLHPVAPFDTHVSAPCYPLQHGCVPIDVGVARTDLLDDSACSRPVVATFCRPSVFELESTLPPRWFRVTEEIPQPAQLYELSEEAVCRPSTRSLFPGIPFYRGEPIEVGPWVLPEPVTCAGVDLDSNWLAVARARYLRGYHSRALDSDCLPRQLEAGTWRCVPNLGVIDNAYTTPSCDDPIQAVFGDEAYAVSQDERRLGTARHVFTATSALSGPLYYRGGVHNWCLPTSASARRLGPEIPIEAFPLLTPVVE